MAAAPAETSMDGEGATGAAAEAPLREGDGPEATREEDEEGVGVPSPRASAGADDRPPIILTQFRPARAVQAYMIMAGIPYIVENAHYPYFASTGALPQLQHGKVLVGGRDSLILAYLRKLDGKDLDAGLREEERADAVAVAELCEHTLADALVYARYGSETHYERTTKYELRKSIVFPLKWILPPMLRWHAVQHLERHGMMDVAEVKRRALEAYGALETKLAVGQPYLFGEKPSSADALLYGHLDAAMSSPVLRRWLSASNFTLLRDFHKFVKAKHFDSTALDFSASVATNTNAFEEAAAAEEAAERMPQELVAEQASRRTTDIMVAVAGVALFALVATQFVRSARVR